MPRLAPRRGLTLALVTAVALVATLTSVRPAAAAQPGYDDAVLAAGPVAYYRLGEAAGLVMSDSSGNGHHGTYAGLETLGQPPAITVDTDTSATFLVGASAAGIPAPTTAYTLEAWVRPADGAPATLVGQVGAGELFISGGFLGLDQTGDQVLSAGPDLTAGTWWHVAATWDGATTRLFVNGIEVATSNTANTAPAGSGVLNLAAGPHGGFIGGMDEVAYYPSALSAATLADHVALGRDATAPLVTITTPVDRDQFVLHAAPAPAYSCTDPLAGVPPTASGIRSCTAGPFAQALGPHHFTVTGIDRAGNETTSTVGYTVVPNRYDDEVMLSSPVAYYRLGDPVGAVTMADHSGHGNDGTYKNAVAAGQHRPAAIACERRPRPRVCEPADDPRNSSTHFGGNGYGYVGDLVAPQSAYTLEAWIRRDDHSDGSIVGQGGAGQLFVRNDRLGLRQTQDDVLSPAPNLPVGDWVHVAATWNGATTRLYVNGVEVAFSSTANKAPSGSATMYVGLGEQAPPFVGDLDEVAYYATALSGGVLAEHHAVATAYDWPSLPPMPPGPNTGLPSGVITTPAVDALYAPAKVPVADFACTDPDGPTDVVCDATVDGNPIANGAPLPNTLGSHVFVITATDTGGNVDTHSVTYTVMPFADIYRADSPLAYYRLGDLDEVMADASTHGRDGLYKNSQQSGPVGISGDGDTARRFWGDGGYGYADNVGAGEFEATVEAWVNPDDLRDQSIAGLAGSDELLVQGGLFVYRHEDRTVSAGVGPTPGVFTQVVGVWDGATVRIFVDGTLRGTAPAATGRSTGNGTFYVGLGTRAPWFKGSLDEVAYYGSALTPERVLEHYLADPPPPPSECRVPKLRGLRLATARTLLERAGCRLGTVVRQDAVDRKRGRVLAQSLAVGGTYVLGRRVGVTVGR